MAFNLKGLLRLSYISRKLDLLAQTKSGMACLIANPFVYLLAPPAGPARAAPQPLGILKARLGMAGLEAADRACVSGCRVHGEPHEWMAGLGWGSAAAASFVPDARFCRVSAEPIAR